jgi:DNA mismatch repair ATPase MutS
MTSVMSTSQQQVLDAGRHPLTERVVELFVANDTVMGRANDRLQVSQSSRLTCTRLSGMDV